MRPSRLDPSYSHADADAHAHLHPGRHGALPAHSNAHADPHADTYAHLHAGRHGAVPHPHADPNADPDVLQRVCDPESDADTDGDARADVCDANSNAHAYLRRARLPARPHQWRLTQRPPVAGRNLCRHH